MLHGEIPGIGWNDAGIDAGWGCFGCRTLLRAWHQARAGEGTEQHAGELRPDAGLLVLEVHEHIGAGGRAGADGLRPAPEVLGRVALVAQTKIAVARRDLHGGRE